MSITPLHSLSLPLLLAMAATARPSRPVAPDVFTLASSNTHSPADLAGLESRASEVSTPALGGSPDVAPGPGQRGRVEEEPNHANEKAPLDSQGKSSLCARVTASHILTLYIYLRAGTRPSEPAMSAYARSSLPSFDRAQEQPGVPAWAPFFASNASYRDAESLDSDKSGDRGAHQRQGLSASVPPFDPVIGHFVRTVPPRSRPEVAQDRPWSSSLPRGRGFSGESLPPRSDRHESPFRPVDPPPRPANPISRQESHAASWTWLPRSDDTPRSSPATASRLEQPAPNASGSTQGSPARFGGALIDLADDTDGSSPSAKNKNKGPFATRYVFLQDLRPEMSEEEFGSRIKVRPSPLVRASWRLAQLTDLLALRVTTDRLSRPEPARLLHGPSRVFRSRSPRFQRPPPRHFRAASPRARLSVGTSSPLHHAQRPCSLYSSRGF